MHVTVLAVPGCPHLPVLDERLAEALDGLPGVSVSRQVIAIEDEAARSGMHGSPAILIDGLDATRRRMRERRVEDLLVTTPDGVLIGVVDADR